MRVLFSTLIPALALAACAAPEQSSSLVESATQPIIKGEDSPSGVEDSVVLLIHLDQSSGQFAVEACTATFLTPNLILTAHHCVAGTDEASACNEKGQALYGGKVDAQYDPTDLYVFTGNTRPDFSKGRPDVAAIGKKIFVPEGKVICNADLALVQLDRDVEGAKIAAMRLDGPAVADETITSIGWGVTEKTDSPDTRQRRQNVPITNVGPLASNTGRALGDTEFEVGESICSGDSGGPAISTTTGAILGVVSRGGNGSSNTTDASAGCVGKQTFNIYTGIAGHKQLILDTIAEVGGTPWIEGELNPILGAFGTACTAGDECQQAVCTQTSGDSPSCNLDCSVDGNTCPTGFQCTDSTDADAGASKVCTAIPAVTKDEGEDGKKDGGCAASPAPATGMSSFAVFGLALVGLAARRRARR